MLPTLTKEKAINLFELAGFRIEAIFILQNGYWPKADCFLKLREDNPWFLVKVPQGLIEIGARKKVYSLNWEHTPLRQILPFKPENEYITRTDTLVHSWGIETLLTDLCELRKALADITPVRQSSLL